MTSTLDRPAPAVTAGPSHSFAGTWQLFRLALRRDRITLPISVYVIGLIPAATVSTYNSIYATAASRASLTAGLGASPSVRLIYGPAFDLSTAGGYTAWKYGTFLPVLLALACIFAVVRHTRAEEDSGRLELLASAVVGRFAPLTAAVSVAGAAALASGLIAAVGLVVTGLPVTGSVAFGLGLALVGWVFTGVAAAAAQLVTYARTANGISSAILGVVFLLRAAGDSSKDVSWLSWLSPIGWNTQLRAYAGERWWILGLLLTASAAMAGVAYFLLPRRDLGMGLWAARPGPTSASARLKSPFALAWRLQRGALIGWLIGFAVMGGVLGSLVNGIDGVIGDSEQARQIFERMGGSTAVVQAYIASLGAIFGVVIALYAVQATLRMRSEETGMRVEPLLATSVGRLRWAAGHLVFALLGSVLVLVVAGASAGLFSGLQMHDVSGQVTSMLKAMLAQVPAVWVVAGAAMLLYGVRPRWSAGAWGVVSVFLLITLIGPAANLGQAVMDISPFTHIPKLPSAPFTATPLVWLLIVAAAAFGVGLASFRRRDIG
ncbi:MAG: transporter permease [Amycolatopsis sp.]|uniref:ABC transporter permease n=1 Tax=Amycolatopsis sp. TaxID=37632 RepID=UPI002637F1A7|nr:ABC transporter permease [Amycolatopsis sp.]MCU1687359.1 transporter permease [Amycolatopsis sp.]